MKVAVASSDGIVINQHFGRADTFLIYELTKEKGAEFIEKRNGRPFCHGGEHLERDLLDSVELLADCEKVFVLQIGRGASEALRSRNTEPVVARGIIEEVLAAYGQGI